MFWNKRVSDEDLVYVLQRLEVSITYVAMYVDKVRDILNNKKELNKEEDLLWFELDAIVGSKDSRMLNAEANDWYLFVKHYKSAPNEELRKLKKNVYKMKEPIYVQLGIATYKYETSFKKLINVYNNLGDKCRAYLNGSDKNVFESNEIDKVSEWANRTEANFNKS